ncbi:MAG: hypothetical protein EPO65_10980 [Dehalococcoidia bacterium]|nr:MAG: hypothetical protein EPO65_10980 [Dehalococcoidia bacterium]
MEATRERLWMGWLTEAHGYLENTEDVYIRNAEQTQAEAALDLLAQVNRGYTGPDNRVDPSLVTKPQYWTDDLESAISVEYVQEVEGLVIDGVLYVPARHWYTPEHARAEYDERVAEWAKERDGDAT